MEFSRLAEHVGVVRGMASPHPRRVVPDASGFERQPGSSFNAAHYVYLGSLGAGNIDYFTLPEAVPWTVMETMGWDGAIWLGEQAIQAPIDDEELYFLKGGDPAVRKRHEAWLRPLLVSLVPVIARAHALGRIPIVLDWMQGQVPQKPVYWHVNRGHDIFPSEADLELDGDDVVGMRIGKKRYGYARTLVPIFGRHWGGLIGRGSRRRAYRPWFEAMETELRQARYHDRSVDPPRLGYAPKGSLKVAGNEKKATEILTAGLMALKNGGVAVLPNDLISGTSERAWSVDVLPLPDRSDVWHKALNRFDGQKLMAALVPPQLTGVEESSFASSRVISEMFVEFAQQLAKFVAEQLTHVVRLVHEVSEKRSAECPVVRANRLPRARQKMLLDVFKQASNVPRALKDGREVTLAELVDEELLDQLGVPRRQSEDAAREKKEPPSFGGGRPREATSERDERRDNAREPEGEDATGAEDEGTD